MGKTFKVCMSFLFVLSYSLGTFAIGTPEIRKPDSDNVSLKPTFYWGPIKNADNYTYKLKQLNDDGTTTTTLETGTVTAPSTSFTVTDTLNVNTHYVLILRAVDGSTGEQSTKEKFYFQAKDKKVIITHADLIDNDELNSFDRGNIGSLGRVKNFANFDYAAHGHVVLPDSAVITGFHVRYNDLDSPAIFELARITRTDLANQTISNITTAGGGVGLIQSSGVLSGDVNVNNKLYTYEIYVQLGFSPGGNNLFSEAEITYID